MAGGELGQDNLQRALKGVAEVLDLEIAGYSDAIRDAIENGRIQKFEYCAELFWKYVRSCLQAEGKEVRPAARASGPHAE
jgi:hypothetical protein